MKPADLPAHLWRKYNRHFIFEHFLGYKSFTSLFGNSHKKLVDEIKSFMEGRADSNRQFKIKETNTISKDLGNVIVYRGLAADWPGASKWNLDYFAENYGDREITITDNVGSIDRKNPQQFEKLKLGKYIQQIKSGSLKYLKFSSIVQKEKDLQDDLNLSWLKNFLLPASFGEILYLFMGGKNSVTPLHDELPCNVYVQISGQKKWILYPAEDRIFLNPRTERRSYFFSHLDPKDENNPGYPLQKYARKVEIILSPGDVLWVPPFFWHYIENLTDSIGVSYKFVNLPASFRSSRLLTMLVFLSTRPSLLYTFFANRLIKGDYLMTKKIR